VPGYEPISVIAAGLRTDEETLLDFRQKGWIQAVERRGTVFLSADQRYRAKYILYLLKTKHLNDDQIQLILSTQRPPYSAAEVDRILKRPGVPPKPGDASA
jgi:hypothetical protein